MTTLTPRAGWWRASSDEDGDAPGSLAPTDTSAPQPSAAPFWALMALTVILFLAPQSLFPALAPLRIGLIAAVLGIVTHLVDRFRRGQPFTIPPRELLIALALGAWALLMVPLSLWPGGSLAFLHNMYLKTFVIFWLLIGVVCTPARLVRVAWALSLIACPIGLTAVRHFLTGQFVDMNIHVKRIVGFEAPLTQNPNDLALILNMILPLTVALFLLERRPVARGVLLASILLGITGVVATFSRTGFLTLATIILAYLVKLRGRPERRFAWALLVLALLGTPFLPSGYLDRLDTIADVSADSTGSAQARARDMLAAATYVLRHPIVGTGAGMGALGLNQVRGDTWSVVHNSYLEYAVDLGVPGLLMFLFLVVSSVRCTVLAQRRMAGVPAFRELFHLAEGLQISLVAFALAAANFQPGGYNVTFYFFAGLAIALQGLDVGDARRVGVQTR